MATIKETMEALEGIEAIAGVAQKIEADGKFNFAELLELWSAKGAVVDGLKGANLIPAELADLDKAELAQLATKGFEVGSLLVADVIGLIKMLQGKAA